MSVDAPMESEADADQQASADEGTPKTVSRKVATESMSLRLTAVTSAAEGTNLFEFRRTDDHPLPPFTAGAHIDVNLPNGLIRQYSLVNPQNERHRYVIGVKLDRESRGGSSFMHESIREGGTYAIAGTRNNFPLVEDAPHVVLLAGGIGITPIWCMVQRLAEIGASWELHYACRNRGEAAFHDELATFGDMVRFHFDDECGGKILDIAAIVADAPGAAHLYCCGPAPMLAAFEEAAVTLPPERVHVEYFTAKEERATEGGFTVELAKSGLELEIPPGKTILEVIREAGIEVESLCEEGFCFTCETRVISGIPDHRDSVLSDQDRAEGEIMLICCSGSLSDRLVLDL